MVIHTFPRLCFEGFESLEENEISSKDIIVVACKKCLYYKSNPEARELERKFRMIYNISSREVYCERCKEKSYSDKPNPICSKCNLSLITVIFKEQND